MRHEEEIISGLWDRDGLHRPCRWGGRAQAPVRGVLAGYEADDRAKGSHTSGMLPAPQVRRWGSRPICY